jgi:hypothetical protein
MKWLVLLSLTACGVEERPPPSRFVGTIDGARTLVFVVADPNLTSAYACDGTQQPALFEWFSGDTAQQMTLTSDSGAATLEIDLDAQSGSIGGEAVVLEPVDDRFGLYRGSKTEGEDTYEVGIILLDEQTQNGVVGITTEGSAEVTTVVTPRIQTDQRAITLLNDVRIPLTIELDAYNR